MRRLTKGSLNSMCLPSKALSRHAAKAVSGRQENQINEKPYFRPSVVSQRSRESLNAFIWKLLTWALADRMRHWTCQFSRLTPHFFFFLFKQIINALAYLLGFLVMSSSHLGRLLYSALGSKNGMFIKPDTHTALGTLAILLKYSFWKLTCIL